MTLNPQNLKIPMKLPRPKHRDIPYLFTGTRVHRKKVYLSLGLWGPWGLAEVCFSLVLQISALSRAAVSVCCPVYMQPGVRQAQRGPCAHSRQELSSKKIKMKHGSVVTQTYNPSCLGGDIWRVSGSKSEHHEFKVSLGNSGGRCFQIKSEKRS